MPAHGSFCNKCGRDRNGVKTRMVPFEQVGEGYQAKLMVRCPQCGHIKASRSVWVSRQWKGGR